MRSVQFVSLVASALLTIVAVEAKVVSGTPFSDNMVLQRGMKVPVWGTAKPGERVKVSFAGVTKKTNADTCGRWRVTFDPMPASKENRVLKIEGHANVEEFKNVLVGEVWFASGQSNMECPIWGAHVRYRDGQGAMMTKMITRRNIRYAKNKHNWSAKPLMGWKSVWRDFSPESFKSTFGGNLSAVAFYYALELYGALDIPIGIIDSSWGGTNIDAWTPRSGYANHPELADVAAFPVTADWKPEMRKGPIGGAHQQPTALYNGMVAGWAPFAIRGLIWYQGCHNAGEPQRYCDKMHALYDGWAKEFENSSLKLYFAQLAPWRSSWFAIQQAQAKFAAEEKNAALVTTCDIGNNVDIHPNDKETVARRLALHALRRDYGFADIVDNAPVLKGWRTEGNKLYLSFSDATQFYVYNDDMSVAVPGFEVAGLFGGFKPAKVCNKTRNGTFEGSELILSADGIAEPRRVRYLANRPWNGSLYSFDSGLPIGPFELDARKPEELRRGTSAKLNDALAVPELAGYRRILLANLPANGGFTNVGYEVDNTAKAGAFKRVAYVLELERNDGTVDWVVASMDAFTTDAAKLGVPASSKAFFQQKVSNLVVRSNMAEIPEGNFPDGGVVEFFNMNYGMGCSIKDIGGAHDKYDFNDSADRRSAVGYGCMQVHNAKAGVTLFAYNNFRDLADIGIGNNNEGPHPDWTFMGNARRFRTRRLTVFVK